MDVRVYSDLALQGALAFEKNEAGFPDNPKVGTLLLKGDCLYGYINVGGLETWYPFASKTSSYIHTQGLDSLVWIVNHGLGTSDLWFQVKDQYGQILQVSKTDIDNNSFKLNFTAPARGTVMVVAPSNLEVPQVKATRLDVGNGAVLLDSSGVRINGQYALTSANIEQQISDAVAPKADKIDTYTKSETDERIQNIVGAAPAALDTLQEIAAQLASDQDAFTSLTAVIATKANITDVPTNVEFTSALAGKADSVHQHVIADVTGLQAALDTKVDASFVPANATQTVSGYMSNTDKTKLDGIADGAVALSTVQIVADAAQAAAALDATAKADAAQAAAALDATAKANAAQAAAIAASAPVVHVHNAATSTDAGFMSAADKTKLDGIAAGATAYVHPASHPASIIAQDVNNRFVSDAEKATWNAMAPQATTYTKAETDSRIQDVVGAAPAALDTLQEIAAQLATDESAVAALTTVVSTKVTAAEAAAAAPVQTVAGRAGDVTLTSADVGLGNVNNTSDLAKPISTATQTALNAKQPLDADLTAIANLTGTSGLLKKTAANTWTLDTTAYSTLTVGSTVAAALGTAAAGTATTAARSDHVHPLQTTVSGNAGSATKLATARTINGVSFDGTADITINAVDSTARQPLDADLTAIANLTGTTGLLKKTAADTWTLDTTAYSTLALGSTAGAALAATGSAGTATTAAKSDHVHPFPTAANVGAEPAFTTLEVAKGGTGATTLTGLVKGNGTSAMTAATAGTDYVAPGTATTFTATQTFKGIGETVYNLTGTDINPANGTIQYKTLTASTTFTESLADGQSVILMLNPSTFAATWPTTTWIGSAASTAPTLVASVYNCITFFQIAGTLYGKYEGRV